MTDETTDDTMCKASDIEETAAKNAELNEEQPVKIWFHGSNEGVKFEIGSSFTEYDILYLNFTDNKNPENCETSSKRILREPILKRCRPMPEPSLYFTNATCSKARWRRGRTRSR